MVNTTKKILACTLLLLLLCTSVLAMSAQETDFSTFVVDKASLFTEKGIQDLETKIKEIAKEHNIAAVIVTAKDVPAGKYVQYADDYYDYHGYGFDASKSGVLLLIDINNRMLYISTTGSMIRTITDRRIESILDKITPAAKKNNYDRVAHLFLNSIENYLAANSTKIKDLRIWEWAIIGIAFLIGFFALQGAVQRSYNLAYNTYQYNMQKNADVEITDREDRFSHQNVSRTRIESSSSRSGSSTHTGSSGTSHGGGGRSF